MTEFLKNAASRIIHNIGAILLSIGMAAVLWLVISLQVFPDITLHIPDIPVSSKATSLMDEEHLEVVSFTPRDIAAQIKGKRYQIGSLKSDDFAAGLDLSEIDRAGDYTVDIKVNSSGDEQYDLVGNYTAHIRVVKMETVALKLDPDISAVRVADGMRIDTANIAVKPDKLIVRGEKSVIDSLKAASVKVEYDGTLSSSMELNGAIQFYNKSDIVVITPEVTYDIASFSLVVPVVKLKPLDVTVTFLNAPPNFDMEKFKTKVRLQPETITVSAPASDTTIDKLPSINIGEIPLSELTLADIQRVVSLPVSLPEGYGNISGNAVVAMMFNDVDNYGSMSFEVSKENFAVTNIPSGYTVKFITNKVDVNVVGPSTFIKSMSPDDIHATVNLAGVTDLDSGEKNITASFRILGANIDAWVTGEHKLSLQLIKDTDTP